MKIVERNVKDFFNSDFKEYSLYTVHHRAIPALLDGFKPVQRKILWTALRRAKSSIKIIGLGGYVVAESNYHHGDASVNDAISKMGASWSNNIPLLDGKGNFGCRNEREASAPRYISVKVSNNFTKWFSEFNVTKTSPQDDGNHYEPDHYFSLVPWNLINGITGVATGYSVKIYPRDPKKVAKVIYEALSGKTPDPSLLDLSFPSDLGTIEGFHSIGSVEHVRTNIWEVTALPVSHNLESYSKVLDKLIEKGIVKHYQNTSSDTTPPFKVWLTKEGVKAKGDIINKLKLDVNLGNETFVFIHDHKVMVFETAWDYVMKFMEERLKVCKASLAENISSREIQVIRMDAQIRFIEHMIKEGLDGLTKAELKKRIEYISPDPETRKGLYSLTVQNLTVEKMGEVAESIRELIGEIEQFNKFTPESWWKSQLVSLL